MSSNKKIKKIVIIQEHSIVRAGLRVRVEQRPDFTVVGEAGNCAEAVDLVERKRPHVIIIDTDLHGKNGIAFLPDLFRACPQSRALILTDNLVSVVNLQAIRDGASAMFHKNQGSDAFLAAIERVIKGEDGIDNASLSLALGDLNESKTVGEDEKSAIEKLTNRQREIVLVVSLGMKHKEAADRLSISETTLNNHLTSIFKKLSVSNRMELAMYARDQGLI
jgi:DNA-binding NarL/FixJ family response regulator